MKSRTFKLFISTYGNLTISLVVFANFVIPILGSIIADMNNKSMLSSCFLVGGINTIIVNILIRAINKRQYKLYQERLHDDALQMAEQLRMNHLCNPDTLDKLIKELLESDVIKHE